MAFNHNQLVIRSYIILQKWCSFRIILDFLNPFETKVDFNKTEHVQTSKPRAKIIITYAAGICGYGLKRNSISINRFSTVKMIKDNQMRSPSLLSRPKIHKAYFEASNPKMLLKIWL